MLTPAPKTFLEKITFLTQRAEAGQAEAVELAALASYALARGDIAQAWTYVTQGFRKDALHPAVEASLLQLVPQVAIDETAPYLDLIIRYEVRPDILARALSFRYGDEVDPVFGRVTPTEHGADVWVTCRTARRLDLIASCANSPSHLTLVTNADHPLASAFGTSAGFFYPWTTGADVVHLACQSDEVQWIEDTVAPPGHVLPLELPPEALAGKTIIVIPVHSDADATRQCLLTLTNDGEDNARREIIVVNDASPDPQMLPVLREAEAAGMRIVTNTRNLGFTASINRILAALPPADVVLLNSDTLLPTKWLSRLQAVAASDPKIGTVTPLTNNGESVSAPKGFVANPLLSPAEINQRSDRLWQQFGAAATDIPAGIGFCLYITRDARDVGRLLDDVRFGRGYLEEVDFCLRLKQLGFRNVCAPGVYVGHRGETSFGLEKAYLVARNTRVLQSLHPDHEDNYQAFALNDPLKDARQACRS